MSIRLMGRERPLAALLVLSLAAAAAPGLAGEITRTLKKEVRFAEEVFDDMLVDSPNWLVWSGGPAVAGYVEGIGLVVGFQASLVDRRSGVLGSRSGAWRELLGDRFLVRRGEEEEDAVESEDDRDREKRIEEGAERRYARGKEEIREAMVEAADLMDSLADGDWMVVVVGLGRHDLFRKSKIDKLTFKARVGELRRLAKAGPRPEKQAPQIVEEES